MFIVPPGSGAITGPVGPQSSATARAVPSPASTMSRSGAASTASRRLCAKSAWSGARTLAPGQNEVQVKFESPVVGGVKLVKTYTFRRGDYVIKVDHQVINESAAPVSANRAAPAARENSLLIMVRFL